MLLYQILASIIHGKIKKNSCKNKKFKISNPFSNKKIELSDQSCSVSDIQGYFDIQSLKKYK